MPLKINEISLPELFQIEILNALSTVELEETNKNNQ